MAHIEDHGSHFDAPIEIVWKFIQSPDDHGRSHTDRRNVSGTPSGPNSLTTRWEQHMEGQWIEVENKVTMFPPVAMMIESVKGPLEGSKFLFYYGPKGPKTSIDVVGDFHSKVIPAAHLEATVLKSLEDAFNDDSASIRAMAARK